MPALKPLSYRGSVSVEFICSFVNGGIVCLGPAVVLSFLIGGLVTLLNALCFTEYAAKTPKTGAQYTYMYETIGEGVAFLVGWTLAIGELL